VPSGHAVNRVIFNKDLQTNALLPFI